MTFEVAVLKQHHVSHAVCITTTTHAIPGCTTRAIHQYTTNYTIIRIYENLHWFSCCQCSPTIPTETAQSLLLAKPGWKKGQHTVVTEEIRVTYNSVVLLSAYSKKAVTQHWSIKGNFCNMIIIVFITMCPRTTSTTTSTSTTTTIVTTTISFSFIFLKRVLQFLQYN